ncbi:unnamed protein product [Discosporangium mesarthrocarpum]
MASFNHSSLGECPLGCGEEVPLRDLHDHETSLCPLRYVECPTFGCGTMVQAKTLKLHQKQQCQPGKKNAILAEKGKEGVQEVPCGACKEMVRRKDMRKHELGECAMRLVLCSVPNCQEMIQARNLIDHRRSDCIAARNQAMHMENAATRPKVVECSGCHTGIEAKTMQKHLEETCPYRSVACPNNALGCPVELPAVGIPQHLLEACAVEEHRGDLAVRHEARFQMLRCPGCGYNVRLQRFAHHQRERCPNRRIPCKNWELGCTAIVRMSDMDQHLKVDRLLDPRPCLAFNCGKAYISIGEVDQKPPWTAEFWVWCPSLVEGTREKARTALKAYWAFQQASKNLVSAIRRLEILEPLLVSAATAAAKDKTLGAEETREKLTDEMIQVATHRDNAKVDLAVSHKALLVAASSAQRGVEEIRSHGHDNPFERLPLGTPPWYSVVGRGFKAGTNSSSYNERREKFICQTLDTNTEGAQGRTQSKDTHTTSNEELNVRDVNSPNTKHAVLENIDQVLKSESVVGKSPVSRKITESDEQLQGDEDIGKITDSMKDSFGPDVAVGGGESNKRRGVSIVNPESVSPLVSRAGGHHHNCQQVQGGQVSKDIIVDHHHNSVIGTSQKMAADNEADSVCEADFWGKWVAMDGPSLASQITHLAHEALHTLREEMETAIGLAAGELGVATNEHEVGSDGQTGKLHSKVKRSKPKKGRKNAKAARKAKRKQQHAEQFGVNLKSRIAEKTTSCGGTGTLFGSGKVMFQLEMGKKDQVGVCVLGEAEHIFNYRCPRQRWVHLSFVSNSGGLVLLENGKPVSRAPVTGIPLPMRDIGGRENACQCLIQEVRYWGVERSRDEVVEWMHQALPPSAVENGLLGYWTLEEGKGCYLRDVTEQRDRVRMVGHGLEWVIPELLTAVDVGKAPTPSWREANVCKVELRRGRLAQRGRLHQLCHAYAARKRMAEAGMENQELHPCPHCGDMVKLCNLSLHLEHVCQWVKVPCRNAGCFANIPKSRLMLHELRYCKATIAKRRRFQQAKARQKSTYKRDWAVNTG